MVTRLGRFFLSGEYVAGATPRAGEAGPLRALRMVLPMSVYEPGREPWAIWGMGEE